MWRYTLTKILFYSVFLVNVIFVYGVTKKNLVKANEHKYISTTPRSANKLNLRVIGGIEDEMNEYPFVVALGAELDQMPVRYRKLGHLFNKEFIGFCTGNLLSEQWVLTAAHCILIPSIDPLPLTKIRYGNMTVSPNSTMATYSTVLKSFPHNNYHKTHMFKRNDIGLLLVQKIHLSVYGRVSAVDYRTLVGMPVVYVGFGKTNFTYDFSERKVRRYGEAAVMSCSEYVLSLPLRPVLCLARRCANRAQMAYEGDSGGPLLYSGQIVGICSFLMNEHGLDLAEGTLIYTPTSPFLDWISEVMSSL